MTLDSSVERVTHLFSIGHVPSTATLCQYHSTFFIHLFIIPIVLGGYTNELQSITFITLL